MKSDDHRVLEDERRIQRAVLASERRRERLALAELLYPTSRRPR